MTTRCGLKGRESCLAESGSRDLLQAATIGGAFSSQGIGLRPQMPWAGVSRPVGSDAEMAHLLRDEP